MKAGGNKDEDDNDDCADFDDDNHNHDDDQDNECLTSINARRLIVHFDGIIHAIVL